jgi:energy-coupling factor transporter ATP-binding protein EcfA2
MFTDTNGIIPVLTLILLTVIITVGLLGLLIITIFIIVVHSLTKKKREAESLNSKLLQVTIQRDNEIKIDAADQFFSSLVGMYRGSNIPFVNPTQNISFEIVGTPESIKFYINVPDHLHDLVEKQLHASYPGAEVRITEEHNIFTKEGKVAYTALKLRKANFYPTKTYKELAIDPLSAMTTALAKMEEGEGAIIQILISAASNKWVKQGYSYVKNQRYKEAEAKEKPRLADAKELEAVEQKIAKAGFYTEIRIVSCAPTKDKARMHLDNIKSVFDQFSSPYNSWGKRKIWFKKNFITNVIYRYMPLFGSMNILNSEELATTWHLPNKTIETPFIYWLNSKRAPAPANIPHEGLFIGNSIFRGLKRPVYISPADRQRHMYIIGKTGVGKSELLKLMALQDINEGRGLCVIDPHGTMIEDIMRLLPPERAEDVIYFNPGDVEFPLGLNLLEANTEDQKHFMVNAVIGLMQKLFDPHQTGIIGPRFEHAVRNAMLTVMSVPGNSFIEVVRVLTDQKYLQTLLPHVQDPIVRRYWTDQIAQTSDFHKSEVLDYIVSKFGRFVTNKMMRNIIGQRKSAFSFREAMDTQKILLINLSKGDIGEENSNFLGLILVPRILVAAMSRADLLYQGKDFPDFYLYVDEFQNFATDTFTSILAEARKFKLNLIVANQFIGQMEENIKNAIFGNVGTIISFRVGVQDAQYLAHEFAPIFTEQDLTNVDKFNCYVKTIVKNQPVPAFSIDTTKDIAAEKALENIELAENIKELSRLKYGIPRSEVEAEIQKRSNL